jgi:hypothetical protein
VAPERLDAAERKQESSPDVHDVGTERDVLRVTAWFR